MPLPINVREVLEGQVVEWERLEFKAGWNPEAVLHTLCAFANDFHNLGGGYLFIGIEERDGRPVLPPVGLEPGDLDRIQKEIVRLGHRITPSYHPVVEPYVIDGRHVLALWAPGGTSRPYKAPLSLAKDNPRHAFYIRKASSTVEAKGGDERDLISLAAHVPFDDRPNQRASLDDLQLGLIQAHLREIGSDLLAASGRMDFAALCERMKIVDGPREHRWPRNVGLLFFNDQPEEFFPQVQIDVVQFPDGPGGDRIFERTFTGPLGRQLRDALAYIRNVVLEETVQKFPDRAEADRYFNYPYTAVEEALVNAVYHRSYEEREPIEVRVLPDHLTVTSFPGPDRSISIADLKAGSFVARRYRNRRIGEFLKELKLTEGRGTGVPKIVRAMRANGSPPPKFKTDRERSYFVTILPIHPGAQARMVGVEPAGGLPSPTSGASPRARDGTEQVTGQVTEQVVSGLTPRELDLLRLCEVPRNRSEIMAELGLNSREHVRSRYLQPLLDRKLLELTQPNSPRSPTQRYRTTGLGLAALDRSARA